MGENTKVLIIDDDLDFINGLTLFLRKDHCEVYSADNIKHGLEKVRAVLPDIILLDVVLPDGNGFELCKTLKNDPETANILVILCSGHKTSSDIQAEGLESGADGYLTKAMSGREMQARLKIFIQNKQYEKALLKSEERFRLAQEMSPDGFTILHPLKDENGEIIDFTWVYENQTIARINGTDPKQVTGKRLLELFPAHKGTELFNAYIQAAKTGKSQVFEEVYVGEIISVPTWLRLVVVPSGDDISIFAEDITARKSAAEALRSGEAKFRAILDASPVPFALNDEQQKILYLNTSFEKTFGYNLQDIPDLTIWWRNAYPDEAYRQWVAEMWQTRLSKARQENIPFEALEVNIHCKDGTIRTVLADTVSLSGALKGEHLVSLFDITDRKLAQEALKINEMKYRTLFENSSDAILLMKGDKFIDCNLQTLEIFGCRTPGLILGHTPFDFSPLHQPNGRDSREYALEIINAALTGQTQVFEWVHTKSDGTEFMAEVKLNKLELSNQILLQSIVRDITKRKEAEEALQQAGDILQNMQMGLYVYELENPEDDRSLRMVAANPSSEKLTGIQPDEMIGRYIDEIFPFMRAHGIPKRFADVVRTGKAGEFEDFYYGDSRNLEAAYAVKAFPLPNDQVGITFDNITGLKQAEASLRMSEERFKSIIAVSKTGAWEYHSDKDLLWCSPEYFTMLGYNPIVFMRDRASNLDNIWLYLLHPDDRDRSSRKFAEYLAGGSVGMYESYFRMKHRNGNWVWIWSRGQTLRDSEGNLTSRTLGTHIDITERKQAELEALKIRRFYQAIIEKAPDGIALIDVAGTFKYISPAAKKMFGYDINEEIK